MAARRLWHLTLLATLSLGVLVNPTHADTGAQARVEAAISALGERFSIEEVEQDVWEIRPQTPDEGFRTIIIRDHRIYLDGKRSHYIEIRKIIGLENTNLISEVIDDGLNPPLVDSIPDDSFAPQGGGFFFVIFGLIALVAGSLLFLFGTKRRKR